MIVYDTEIAKTIEETEGGWSNHAGLGISCVCWYDYMTDVYGVALTPDEIANFAMSSEERLMIGFNSLGFDNKLVAAFMGIYESGKNGSGIPWPGFAHNFDIYAAVRQHRKGKGYRLQDIAVANGLGSKLEESGAMAPILFQRGEIGRLVSYCLDDVRKTKKILDLIREKGQILDPQNPKGPPIRLFREWEQAVIHANAAGLVEATI